MNFRRLKYNGLVTLFLVLFSGSLFAQIPAQYYAKADGKKGAELKTALYNIIKNHTVLEYYSSSTSFRTTDWHPATETAPNGYFWDMYSNYERPTWSGMNREHNMPKSWFGISSGQENSAPIGSDLHNLYPSDASANEKKSNFPIGEVTGTLDYTNGVVKVGKSNTYSPQYTGTVFEPDNEYKGDFARDYMYMVTCYEDYSTRWQSLGTSSMLQGGTYPVFNPKAVTLLLKWHRQDPVSSKEIVRNNAVYSLQNNRNPYIDHPELVEFIWGKYIGEAWEADGELPEDEVTFVAYLDKPNNLLTVELKKPEEATYFLKNISGITVKTGHFSSEGTIQVEELRNGMYLLEVYGGTKRRIKKLIVNHN
jgi:endonuclease I